MPLLVREGGMIRAEYNDEVKRLRHIVNDSNDILDSILEREKAGDRHQDDEARL